MNSIKTSVATILFGFMFASCGSHNARISGTFAGAGDKSVYLEQVMGNHIIDSTVCSSSGQWSFKYQFSSNEPSLLRVRMGKEFITLLVSPGEKIDISALQNIGNSYTIKGSHDSELIAQFNRMLSASHVSVDSLYSLYNREDNQTRRSELYGEIVKKYIDQKRECIRFVVDNSTSLASVVALYTYMPNGVQVFGDRGDYAYYKMVADSLSDRYPSSVLVASLKKDVERFDNRKNLEGKISASLSGEQISSPEIVLNDMYDQPHRLTDLRGKIVLLSFWSSTTNGSAILNSELKELYDTYANRGFEIYQVSLDTDKASWVSAITTQKLPWISVCDFKGSKSPAVGSYNVTSIPFNYILDRNGDIVGKNLWGIELTSKIEEVL